MKTAFEPSHWLTFGTVTAEASATLCGLLFIAVSLNLKRILEFPNLPARAGQTLVMLASPLLVGVLLVVPNQGRRWLGWELIAAGLVLAIGQVTIDAKGGRSGFETTMSWLGTRAVPSVVPALCFVLAGATLVTRAGLGLYWVVPGILVSIICGLVNTWVLLIEIQR